MGIDQNEVISGLAKKLSDKEKLKIQESFSLHRTNDAKPKNSELLSQVAQNLEKWSKENFNHYDRTT